MIAGSNDRSQFRVAPVTWSRTRRRWWATAKVAAALAAALALAGCAGGDDDGAAAAGAEVSDLQVPNDPEAIHKADAVELERRDDGLTVTVEFPTPTPGSYDYPTADMIPPGAEPHPPISPGDDSIAEVFTLWMFVFNQPGRCTEGACNADDLGVDAPAQGGVYQVDGRIAEAEEIDFGGTIRIGQRPDSGARLFDPVGAEIHVAVAAHGRVLSGPDLWRQLNGAVGNTTFWWSAAFAPD